MSVDILIDKIGRVRSRWRNVQVTVGVCKSLLAALGLIAGFFLLDWLILSRVAGDSGTDRIARLVLLLAMLGTLGWVVWRTVIRELTRVQPDDELALRIEKQHPELRGRLISTIQLTREQGRNTGMAGSLELIEALEADTVDFAGGMNFGDIINLQVLKKAALAALGLTLLAAAVGAWRSDFAQSLFARMFLSETAYPTAAHMLTVTASGEVPYGESFAVEMTLAADGFLPDSGKLAVRPRAGGDTAEYTLERVANPDPKAPVVYRGAIERVLENMEFRPKAYDAQWKRWETLRVVQRPTVKSQVLTYTYPPYLGKPVETSNVGDIRAITGTSVRIVAALNKQVVSAKLVERLGQKLLDPVAMTLNADKTEAVGVVTVAENGYYKVLLHCVDDLDSANPVEYVIDAIPDRKPTVKITFPAQDKTVTRFAQWPVRFAMRDDFGIAKGWLKYKVAAAAVPGADTPDKAAITSGPSQSIALDGLVTKPGQTEITAEIRFDLKPLNLAVDQRVIYWIEVADNRTPEANIGVSDPYTFTIVDAAVLQGLLDKDRNDALGHIETARDKEKETQQGVDDIRRVIRRAGNEPAPTPAPTPPKP